MNLINYIEDINSDKNRLFIKDKIYEIVKHRIPIENYIGVYE